MWKQILYWLTGEVDGLLRKVPHPKDLHFRELLLGEYKRKSDTALLKPLFPENQYGLSVCSFEAWANALSVYFGEPVSVRWLTAMTWWRGECNRGGTAQLKAGGDTARKYGVVFEKDLPSDETMSWDEFVSIDIEKYKKIAEANKIGSYYWIDTIGEYYMAIDQGYAIVLGRYWTGKFDENWTLLPDRKSNMAHATLGAGYLKDKTTELNSWGTSWGKSGFFACPIEQLQRDIDEFGAIAITPIKYTPKAVKVKSLLEQMSFLKDKIKNMLNASNILYGTAKGLLGTNLRPDLQPLACAGSVSAVIHKAFDEDINIIGTGEMYDYLCKSPKFEKIEEPEKGCIIISPTAQIPQDSPLEHGHVGIYGQYNAPDGTPYIMSNNSETHVWDTQFTHRKWLDYYHIYGKIPVYYFRRLTV